MMYGKVEASKEIVLLKVGVLTGEILLQMITVRIPLNKSG